MRSAPLPYAAAWFDWGQDPYGGGVNFWKPGVKSWELIPRVAHPRPELPVFIVGEAYSKAQGWVEGALQTSELVLQGPYFGLEAPPLPPAELSKPPTTAHCVEIASFPLPARTPAQNPLETLPCPVTTAA